MSRPRSRTLLVGLAALLVAAAAGVLLTRAFSGEPTSLAAAKEPEVAALADDDLRRRFARLSRQHTNWCGLQPASLEWLATGGRLQGSCCQPMVL